MGNQQNSGQPKAAPVKEVRHQKSNSQHFNFHYQRRIGIDDFDFISLLGEGSSGKVVMVRKKDVGQLYAMKILRKSPELDTESVMREKSVMIRMSHPFMIGLHYAFETDENLYLVTDFVEGGDFLKVLQNYRGKLPEDVARFYISQLFLVINSLHENHILYRDLKLENVLLGRDGHLILADFGLAKEAPALSFQRANHEADRKTRESTGRPSEFEVQRTHSLAGTPEYMAPEVMRGEAYGKEVDFWSLGVMLYVFLCGKLPFRGDAKSLIAQVSSPVLKFPDSVSNDARDAVRQLLQPDPNNRMDASQLRSHAFFKSINWDALLKKAVPAPYKPPPIPFSDGRFLFLGGSCDPTTWRFDIAIPALEAAGISYYNPQVDNWDPDLITIEAKQKAKAQILLFVIDKDTRAVASMLEAAEYIGFRRHVILVIEDVADNMVIDGQTITGRQLQDLNRGRAFLKQIAHRNDVPVYRTVDQAVKAIIKLYNSRT